MFWVCRWTMTMKYTVCTTSGWNTGEKCLTGQQLISLKITSTISQENQLSPTKIFSIAMDTDVWRVQISWWNWRGGNLIPPVPPFVLLHSSQSALSLVWPPWRTQIKSCYDIPSTSKSGLLNFKWNTVLSWTVQCGLGTNPLIASTFHVSITVQKSNWVEKSKIFFFFFFWLRGR